MKAEIFKRTKLNGEVDYEIHFRNMYKYTKSTESAAIECAKARCTCGYSPRCFQGVAT